MRELLPSKILTKVTCTSKEHKTKSTHLTSVLLKSKSTNFSIELCPGRYFNLDKLNKINPSFCSVAWLTPTSYINKPESIPAILLAQELILQGHEILLHLTCKNLNTTNAINILNELKRIGIRNILCLQGDSYQTENTTTSACSFPHAVDLIKFIKQLHGDYFCIGVAAYPEGHPQSSNSTENFYYLKQKIAAGANFIITQMTFNYVAFNNFKQTCKQWMINVPIVAGIYIINDYDTLIAMKRICKVNISDEILKFVKNNKNNSEAVKKFGLSHAVHFVNKTREQEYEDTSFHIFSLNNLDLTESFIEVILT